MSADAVLFLQRTCGNAAVGRLIARRAPAANRMRTRLLQRAEYDEGEFRNRPNLVAGDTGAGVSLLQSLLGVKVTGVFDHTTRAAVDQFQRQQGWEPSGVGPMTWEKLETHAGNIGARPNLNLGDRGPGVKLLQTLLGVPKTSVFDQTTRKAVDAFQRAQGWEPSGVGPMTWAALDARSLPTTEFDVVDAAAEKQAAWIADLNARLDEALKPPQNWQAAAEALNAFNTDDMLGQIGSRKLSEAALLSIEMGAWQNKRVGGNSAVAKLTHDVVKSIDPEAYAPGNVFPNNFGDKLGGVGAVVIGAAAGLWTVRLAAPLIAGAWRQIVIASGMAKIAAETEKEEAELAEMELGEAVKRLMATDSGGRVFVTYQSMSPVADKELYLTTEEGAQYAEAVMEGRNLYQLRIPERLFQLLQDRNLIEVRQGAMGNQVGVDVLIGKGAMQFLAQYVKQIPLKK